MRAAQEKRHRQLSACLALLVHLLMVAVLPTLHAGSEQESLRHVTHVEAQDDDSHCPASHEDACATCRVLHHSAVLPAFERIAAAPAIAGERGPVAGVAITPPSALRGSLGSRAPPLT